MFRSVRWKYALAGALALVLIASGAHAAPYRLVYSFAGNTDGAAPTGGLIEDASGNLYGTTSFGGTATACFGGGCGTVYKLTPGGTKTTLYSFQAGAADGRSPIGRLALDADGNLYGATEFGGGSGCAGTGCGTVFKLAPNGTETMLHAFADEGTDGVEPISGVVLDKKGNVFGTTHGGGQGAGIVFRIASNGTEMILHDFGGAGDGQNPNSLVRDRQGDLFGTTGASDSCSDSCGTVFKLTRDGDYSVLYTFNSPSAGIAPQGGLVFDADGNIYGTTHSGGNGLCGGDGCGTVFKLTPAGVESVLYAFLGQDDGQYPGGGVVFDRSGNLFGTTPYGGGDRCHSIGCGTVFMLAPDGTETVLFALARYKGAHPFAGLAGGRHGDFFGTAPDGGRTASGVVFRIRH